MKFKCILTDVKATFSSSRATINLSLICLHLLPSFAATGVELKTGKILSEHELRAS